jgi:hypothetical protein
MAAVAITTCGRAFLKVVQMMVTGSELILDLTMRI